VTMVLINPEVTHLTLDRDGFVNHAGTLFRQYPNISRVTLVDCEPYHGSWYEWGTYQSWGLNTAKWNFPDDLYRYLRKGHGGYPLDELKHRSGCPLDKGTYLTREDAMEALSEACVAFGKDRAAELERVLTEAIVG
jgi:hypothetical protein